MNLPPTKWPVERQKLVTRIAELEAALGESLRFMECMRVAPSLEKKLQDALENNQSDLQEPSSETFGSLLRERDALKAKLKASESNALYWVNQQRVEADKRGEAEHEIDLCRGNLSQAFADLESERDELKARLELCHQKAEQETEERHDLERKVETMRSEINHLRGQLMEKINKLDASQQSLVNTEAVVIKLKENLADSRFCFGASQRLQRQIRNIATNPDGTSPGVRLDQIIDLLGAK